MQRPACHAWAVSDRARRSPLPGVAIVSADRRVRDGLASLLAASGEARVLGPVGDRASAEELLATTQPDAVVVDLTVARHLEQVPLLAELRRLAPRTRLVVIAWDGEMERGVGRGIVDGYVAADGRSPAAVEDILRAVLPPI
jgi:DNA-binding NarL/FixJ family response regulator